MIRGPQVRLISSDGRQLGIYAVDGAIKMAQEEGLDLVEISPQAKPPVCKIMDFGKYKYMLQKKQHDSKKHQTVVHLKEIKLRPN
ncbi:MAG: translation initiation factor IF-3, partial [Deltaproteobacteria bacterium]|nr:translation initiation factor IF-3 [Deltaproteobacteria bacterium]